jgi:hypothetical protein
MPLVLVDGSSQTVFEDQQGQEYLPPKLHEGCQTFPSIGLFWKCLKIQYLVTETQTTALGLDMANWRKSADYPKNRYFYNFSEPSVTNLRSATAGTKRREDGLFSSQCGLRLSKSVRTSLRKTALKLSPPFTSSAARLLPGSTRGCFALGRRCSTGWTGARDGRLR